MTQTASLGTESGKSLENKYETWAKAGHVSGGVKGRHTRIIADYIRHVISRLGAEDGKAAAVHIQRLLSVVRTQLGWLIPPVDEPPWAEHDHEVDEEPAEPAGSVKGLLLLILERLVLLGDCGVKGGGYYLPAPVRKVTLESGNSIIVGGITTSDLAVAVKGRVGWAGLARTIETTSHAFPTYELDHWLRRPPERLSDWTAQVFHRASTSLVDSPGRDGSEFEIYTPLSYPRRGQSNRWTAPRQWSPPPGGNGGLPALHLCRTRNRPRRFWLAPLESSSRAAKFRSEFAVERSHARRLMYGIDFLLGAPTRAEVIAEGTTEVMFRLYSWLPNEEYRLFTSICYQTENAPDTPLPFTFYLPIRFWPDAATALRGLGIKTPEPRH